MARRPEGWKLVRSPHDDGTFLVRFTHGGKRYKRSTGCQDPGAARDEAARIYASIVAGRDHGRRVGVGVTPSKHPLDLLLAEWLVDMESVLDETTRDPYEMYGRVHFIPFFARIDRITTEAGSDYWRARLRRVQRKTVLKELAALRGFLGWCQEKAYLSKAPLIESPPKRATGRPDAAHRYKGEWVPLRADEIDAILSKLPVRGRQGSTPRAFYRVLWETGLRPATLWSLRAPEDYVRGRRSLRIRAEADKNRFAREVPLSDRAIEALNSVCPDVGLIFRRRDLRATLRGAAKAAGLPAEKALRVSDYDFRHARLTHLASKTQNLTGAAYLAGHKHVSTTALYIHPNAEAARDVLRSLHSTEASEPTR